MHCVPQFALTCKLLLPTNSCNVLCDLPLLPLRALFLLTSLVCAPCFYFIAPKMHEQLSLACCVVFVALLWWTEQHMTADRFYHGIGFLFC